MKVFPAIDLKDGHAVRLVQGDFEQKTVVNEDPLAQAKEFQAAGISFIHVVDLDGALDGRATSAELIEAIKSSTELGVEVGGGIRTMAQIDAYAEAGIDRLIIGSAALKDPDLVKAAVAKYGDRIAVGIDAKDGLVAISGWLDVSETDYLTFAKEMADHGVKTIIYTDIARDGTLTGPNMEHYEKLLAQVPEVQIVASGGVSGKADLLALADLGVYGAIVGKAFYNGNITLAEMLEVESYVG